MKERPLCIIVLGFLLGILFAAWKTKWLLLPVFGIGIFLIGSIKSEKSKIFAYGKLALYIVSFVCGSYRYQMQQEFRAEYEPMLYDGMKLTLQGELEEKEYKNNQYLYYLNNCYLISDTKEVLPCNRVIAEMETDVIPIGTILVMKGSVAVFRQARNQGNFDEISFYQSQNIDFKLKKVQIQKIYGKGNRFCEGLYQLKQKLKAVYTNAMSKEKSGVLIRMTLGDKSLMNQEINQLYQKVGISHILAISGLHISVIGMSIYKILRRIFGSYMISGIAAGGIMFAYGTMTGFRPSSTRAIVMFLTMLIAGMAGRTYDSLSALSLSAIGLLWENTGLLWYAGFLFSYGAVLSVVLVAATVTKNIVTNNIVANDTITKSFGKKKKIRDAFYSGFSIQLITIPLTAYFYFEIALYGMFVNLLVLPCMSVLLGFALIGGFIGLLSPFVAKWLLVPCEVILECYQRFSDVVQRLPNAGWITGQPSLWRMLIFYGCVAGLVYWVKKRKNVRGFAAAGILLLIFVLYQPKTDMELCVLDVGQGDGIYLKTDSGYDIFFDGGSTDVSGVGTYRILPFLKYKGVRGIDYWFVSHTDKDHISGLQEVLETGYPIEKLIFSKEMVKDEGLEELIALADAVDTEIIFIGYMDCLHLGTADLRCVFPYEEFVTDDKNAASLVLYYEENDFTGLFTGDIGEKEEQWIAEHSNEWLDCQKNNEYEGVDFYKAAHHGSKYSNSEAFLQVIKPEIAVISSGENNRYGHPHKEAVERLKEAGCEIWNTAESGEIIIKMDKMIQVSYWICE